MSSTGQNQYIPDYAVPPGEILLETIEERGMTQVELSERTGRKKKTINEIIKGKAPITPETAIQLERVLDIPSTFWNNLERDYQASLARLAEKNRLEEQVGWLNNLPVKEMVKWGWIAKSADKVEQVRILLNYFGVASPKQWFDVWDKVAVSYRKSATFESVFGAVASWLRQGEIVGHGIECASYDKATFQEALAKIRELTAEHPKVFQPEIIKRCAAAGVAVVFVPELPKAPISGATRWLSPNKALLQLSLRHKSNDHLWFSFFHEAAHILKHGKTEIFVDSDKDGQKEDEANRFAADFLIPPAELKRFLDRTLANISKAAVRDFACEIGIAPGIVVGRLQNEGLIPWKSHCNDLKVRYQWGAPSAG